MSLVFVEHEKLFQPFVALTTTMDIDTNFLRFNPLLAC